MSEHMTKPLDELAEDVLADGVIDADEVGRIRERIYEDGVIDREEADFLFRLNDGASGAENDPGWEGLFVEAISDHVLKDKTSPGEIDQDEASYLIEKIQADAQVDRVELALLVNLTANATGCTESFNAFVLDALKAAVLEDGIIDDNEVGMIRKVIYGTGSGEGAGIDRAEADFLFELNDAVSGKQNSPMWRELFVEALAKHVLEDEVSPGVIDEAEAEWLIGRIEEDGVCDALETALLSRVKAKAKEIHPKLQAKLDGWNVA